MSPSGSGPRAGGACWPTRSAWRCWWCWTRSRPAERLAFVLHDMFAVPFDEIAPIVGPLRDRHPAARQPRAPPGAGRGHRCPTPTWPGSAQWSTRSWPPSRAGDFDALLAVLDPDVVRARRTSAGVGGRCAAPARSPSRRCCSPRAAGSRGRPWWTARRASSWPRGRLAVAMTFAIAAGRITRIRHPPRPAPPRRPHHHRPQLAHRPSSHRESNAEDPRVEHSRPASRTFRNRPDSRNRSVGLAEGYRSVGLGGFSGGDSRVPSRGLARVSGLVGRRRLGGTR